MALVARAVQEGLLPGHGSAKNGDLVSSTECDNIGPATAVSRFPAGLGQLDREEAREILTWEGHEALSRGAKCSKRGDPQKCLGFWASSSPDGDRGGAFFGA